MAYKRTTGKHNCDYGLIDLYKEYKSESKDPVSYKTYSEFIKEYNERIMNAVIYEALEYKMPYRLGYLRIQKRKKKPYFKDGKLIKKHISIDWKRTLDSWRSQWPNLTDEEIKQIPLGEDKKILLHHNDHTNGYSVRFYWDKRFSNAKNQIAYIYKATRTIKEELASFIKKNGIIEYLE